MIDEPGLPRLLRQSTRVEIGKLSCPTGQLVVCDPFFCGGAVALTHRASAGEYPVVLHRLSVPGWGVRVVAAQLELRPGAVVAAVSPAAVPDGSRARYVVDSGLAAFMDEAARMPFAAAVAEFTKSSTTANYYWDVLEVQFRAGALKPDDPFDAGDHCLHAFGTDPNARVAMFSSGLGDGTYSAHWGLDEAGDRVALLTGFDVLAKAGLPSG